MKRLCGLLPVLLAILSSCANPDYDISEGLNKEITLFEEGISVPIGSIGPFTIESVLGRVSSIEGVGELLGEYLKVDDEGFLSMDDSGDIFRINAYELGERIGDVSYPYTWDAGDQIASMGGMVSLLGYLNLLPINQKIIVSASNPLSKAVHVGCDAAVLSSTSDDDFSSPIDELSDCTLKRSRTTEIASVSLPEDLTTPVDMLSLSGLKLELTSDPVSSIADREGELFFAFTYDYSCGLSVGEEFNLPLNDISAGELNLPIGQFKLKKCEVSLVLESTIPIAVSVSNIRVLKSVESGQVNSDIAISGDITLPGGSLASPATSSITLTIESLSGTIPDIAGVLLDLNLAAQPGLGPVPISTGQGVFLKSSFAKLSGGITIPQDLSL